MRIKIQRCILWMQLQWKFKFNPSRKELVRLGLAFFDSEVKALKL